MIGDKLIDLECGWNAGLKASILVRTGYGAEVEKGVSTKKAIAVDNLPVAAKWILNSQ
jgi:histidinol phosphatase-like enzyme